MLDIKSSSFVWLTSWNHMYLGVTLPTLDLLQGSYHLESHFLTYKIGLMKPN